MLDKRRVRPEEHTKSTDVFEIDLSSTNEGSPIKKIAQRLVENRRYRDAQEERAERKQLRNTQEAFYAKRNKTGSQR